MHNLPREQEEGLRFGPCTNGMREGSRVRALQRKHETDQTHGGSETVHFAWYLRYS